MNKIYCLYHPTTKEVRYVGFTCFDLNVRLGNHKSCARKGLTTHVYKWIRSLLKKGLEPQIFLLEEGEITPEREIHWISVMREHGARLTNHSEGGEWPGRRKWTDEQRKNLSEIIRQKYADFPEYRLKVSEAQKGRIMTLDHKAKMSAAHKNVKLSEEHRKAIGIASTGREVSLEAREKRSERQKGVPRPELIKTHCKHGHEYTEENSYFPPKRPGKRDCLECRNNRNKNYEQRKRSTPEKTVQEMANPLE